MTTNLPTHDVPDEVDADDWRLSVTGAVSALLCLERSDLFSMDLRTVTDDFDCVEGWRATDLDWRGVAMADILNRVGVSTDAEFGLVRAMDGEYACSFPIDRLESGLLAIELDGKELSTVHGGPARFVPTGTDDDCWESVKWVAEIQILEHDPGASDTAREIALSGVSGQ